MIVHDVTQGEAAWFRAKLGLPSASEFDHLVKKDGGLTGKSARTYAKRLTYEIVTNEPLPSVNTDWMQRGNDLEPEAVRMYEFQTDSQCESIGFVTDDDRTMGCSPDRFVGEDGGLEIKCPAGWTHIDYLLNPKHGEQYRQQVQGTLLITGRKWWDRMFYHPLLDPVIIRFKADLNYQRLILAGVKRMRKLLLINLEKLWRADHINLENLSPEGMKLMAQIPGFKAPDIEGEIIE